MLDHTTQPPTRRSIHDVAKASGVSVATVSRVLNGLGGASDRTADHVRRIAVEMEYQPPRIRRTNTLGTGTSKGSRDLAVITLGPTTDCLEQPAMAAALEGIRSACAANQLHPILSEASNVNHRDAALGNLPVDGAIVFVSPALTTDAVSSALASLNLQVPAVCVMGGPLSLGVDHILPDHLATGALAFNYLRRRGCRNVAYVTTSPPWPLMRVRGHGIIDAGCDAGQHVRTFILAEDPSIVCSYGTHVTTAPDPQSLVETLVNASPRIDGIFFGNDRITAELYPLTIRAGLPLGGDVAVVSCDNERARLADLNPRPATIDIHSYEIGRRAVAQLLWRIENPTERPVEIHMKPTLVPAEAN